jgi:arylsulfatase
MVQDQQQATPDKPFFCYLATGAAHAPHQVPAEWIDPYRGQYDEGWEMWRAETFARQLKEGVVPHGTVLTERPSWVAAWGELPAETRRLYARYMEVFAGFVTHTDAHIGRLLDFLAARGVLDETLVFLLSDNGASAEGGPTGTLNEPRSWAQLPEEVSEAYARIDEMGGHRAYNHYPWAWAWAGNTPLRLWKRYAWLGGVRTPLVIRWPGQINGAGEVRSQFCHAVDILPTVLNVVGIDPPEVVDGVTQQRIDGASLGTSFTDAQAPAPRATQYFEMHGSRGIYHNGWKATTDYVSPSFGERLHIVGSHDFDTDHWELFNLDQDFSESHDLSAEHPERARELEQLWWWEAGRNQVLPLNDNPSSRLAIHPGEYPPPKKAVYTPGGGPVSESQLPPIVHGFTLTAELELPPAGAAEGIICAQGDLNEGWAVYLLDGRPIACFCVLGGLTRLAGPDPLGAGRHMVELSYHPHTTQADNLVIAVGGHPVAKAHLPAPRVLAVLSTAGVALLIGRDRGLAVGDDYVPPFPFTGILHRVTIESEIPELASDADTQLEVALHSD